MKILVIGGTSFFGKDIVELALDAGHQVTIFSRGNKQPLFWDHVAHISGDRTDSVDFGKKLSNKQFDVVVDNIAFTAEHVTNALSVFQGNIGRYIFTSSAAVYTNTGPFDQPVTEADATLELPVNPQAIASSTPANEWLINYATGKIEAERALFEQIAVPYTIIRPPGVSGPEDPIGHFYCQRLLDGKRLILTNGGYHVFHPVYRRDLAQSYLLAVGSAMAVNQVYNIAQYTCFRLVDWINLIANYLGVKPNIVSIPVDVVQQANFVYDEPPTDWSRIIDSSKARTDLGFQSTPVELWTDATAQWYLNTIHEHDSWEYTDREKEVEFAEKYLEKIALLNS